MLVQFGSCKLELVQGDITEQRVDAIVNAANSRLAGGGGVDGAIHRAAGPTLMRETRQKYPDGCPTGSAVATAAGKLSAKHVFHAVGPIWGGGHKREQDLLASAIRRCLELAVEHSCRSIAFPAISTGVYGYPIDLAAEVSLGVSREFLNESNQPELVRFVLFGEGAYGAFARVLEAMTEQSFQAEVGSVTEYELRQFVVSDGYRIQCRYWRAQSSRQATIVALHGIQSHSGWFEYSSRRIAEAGFDVFFLDRRGSGMNEEARGHAMHADRLVNDVAQVLTALRNERDRTGPMILMGASWGGKLAAAVAIRRPELVDALALLYPGIIPHVKASRWQQFKLGFANLLGVRFRHAPIPLEDPALFTHHREWQDYIRNDPLALRTASVGFYLASDSLEREVQASAVRIRCPLLLTLAGKDLIINNPATRRLFDQIAKSNRQATHTLLEYPTAAHTLEFEPNRDKFIDDLIEWLGSASKSG